MEFEKESPTISEAPLGRFEIAVPAERAEVINAAYQALAEIFSFSDRDRFVARLCLDEAITNACEHGCLDTAGAVTVSLFAEPPAWVLRVRDQGPGYSGDEVETREVDPYAEGGRGLPILAGYAERVVVAAGGREVTVWLKVGAGAPGE